MEIFRCALQGPSLNSVHGIHTNQIPGNDQLGGQERLRLDMTAAAAGFSDREAWQS